MGDRHAGGGCVGKEDGAVDRGRGMGMVSLREQKKHREQEETGGKIEEQGREYEWYH